MIWLDLAGAICSLLSTYYFIRLNNKAWFFGLIATIVNGWLYWHKGIFADMLLESGYFISMCYGWYQWRRTKHPTNPALTLRYLGLIQWLTVILSFGLLFLCIFLLLHTKTHSNVPMMDALTTSLSLVAQGLMCYKVIMTWILWFITDVLYAFLYFNKNLPVHTALMIFYTGMAITGYWYWSKNLEFKRIKQ